MTKRHAPTEKTIAEVRALAVFGVTHAEIAKYVGIDAKTLRKHYREVLDKSTLQVQAAVGSFIVNAATGRAMNSHNASFRDCLTAAIFYGKTKMGLAEARHEKEDLPENDMASVLSKLIDKLPS